MFLTHFMKRSNKIYLQIVKFSCSSILKFNIQLCAK